MAGASTPQSYRNLAGAEQLVSTTVLINGYLDGRTILGTNVTLENSQCRIRAQPSNAILTEPI